MRGLAHDITPISIDNQISQTNKPHFGIEKKTSASSQRPPLRAGRRLTLDRQHEAHRSLQLFRPLKLSVTQAARRYR